MVGAIRKTEKPSGFKATIVSEVEATRCPFEVMQDTLTRDVSPQQAAAVLPAISDVATFSQFHLRDDGSSCRSSPRFGKDWPRCASSRSRSHGIYQADPS